MAETEVQNSQQGAPDSQQRAHDSQRSARIRELEGEVERYRHASEDALQQLDWCIGYMHGSGKKGERDRFTAVIPDRPWALTGGHREASVGNLPVDTMRWATSPVLLGCRERLGAADC